MTDMTIIPRAVVTRVARRASRASAAALALASLASLAACSLDVTNPNSPTQEAVTTTPDGLRALAIGMQGRFGNSLEHAIWVPGIVSGELGNTNASQSTQREFQKYPIATANAPRIEPTNPDLLAFWSRQFQVVRAANDVLANVGNVQLAPGTKSGITALAKTLKAIAYGTLADAWQSVPLDPSAANPTYSDRAAVLTEALSLLASASADLQATPASTEFTGQVLVPGIDLPNTIRAMQARYSLAAGKYADALTFANQVPASATSQFRYSSVDPNPVWAVVNSLKSSSAIATSRTNAEAGDTRVNKNVGTTVTTPFGGAQVLPINLYTTQADPIPLFTQDELTLIRAEAYARTNQLPQAIAEINKVRQAAGLPPKDATSLPTQQAVLDEIYRQRYYSLFLMGQHWADERRFGRLAEARTDWLPLPAQETVGG